MKPPCIGAACTADGVPRYAIGRGFYNVFAAAIEALPRGIRDATFDSELENSTRDCALVHAFRIGIHYLAATEFRRR